MASTIEFEWRHAAILRMLIYPIQFDTDPLKGIDRVLAREMFASHSSLWPADVIAAIDAGLASGARLSELIHQSHSENVIRGYLLALRKRLESDPRYDMRRKAAPADLESTIGSGITPYERQPRPRRHRRTQMQRRTVATCSAPPAEDWPTYPRSPRPPLISRLHLIKR